MLTVKQTKLLVFTVFTILAIVIVACLIYSPVFTVLTILAIVIVAYLIYSPKTIEGYRDPIWPNKKKMYNDLYPRSNGSIYGTFYQPWNLFSGYQVFPRAY